MNLDLLSLSNLKLLYPAFLCLPLMYLLKVFLRKSKRQGVAYGNISYLNLVRRGLKPRLRTPVLETLKFAVICLLSLAAARPQTIDQITLPAESRNLMLTIDLSGSMGTGDFRTQYGRITRLEGVKLVVAEFIKARMSDRIGIVIFGTNAFLQSPLTMDHSLLDEMVKRLQVGVAGEDTAIGDGLGLSLKRIQDIEGTSKAVILITDGVNHAGEVNPLKAAKIAADLHIKIHTIGIGSKEQPQQSRFGLLLQNAQPAEFDEATLKKIAKITGGVYFNASSLEGLKQVYQQIDSLEKTSADDPNKQIVNELYPQLALAGLVAYCLLILLSRSYFLKVPN